MKKPFPFAGKESKKEERAEKLSGKFPSAKAAKKAPPKKKC